MKRMIRKYGPPIFHCINDFGQGSLAALIPFLSLTLALITINRRPLSSVTPWWPPSHSPYWVMWRIGGACPGLFPLALR